MKLSRIAENMRRPEDIGLAMQAVFETFTTAYVVVYGHETASKGNVKDAFGDKILVAQDAMLQVALERFGECPELTEWWERIGKPQPKAVSEFLETHYEFAGLIERMRALPENEQPNLIREINDEQGTGGFWELAESLTKEFMAKNADREWDGEFFDEVEEFFSQKLTQG